MNKKILKIAPYDKQPQQENATANDSAPQLAPTRAPTLARTPPAPTPPALNSNELTFNFNPEYESEFFRSILSGAINLEEIYSKPLSLLQFKMLANKTGLNLTLFKQKLTELIILLRTDPTSIRNMILSKSQDLNNLQVDRLMLAAMIQFPPIEKALRKILNIEPVLTVVNQIAPEAINSGSKRKEVGGDPLPAIETARQKRTKQHSSPRMPQTLPGFVDPTHSSHHPVVDSATQAVIEMLGPQVHGLGQSTAFPTPTDPNQFDGERIPDSEEANRPSDFTEGFPPVDGNANSSGRSSYAKSALPHPTSSPRANTANDDDEEWKKYLNFDEN